MRTNDFSVLVISVTFKDVALEEHLIASTLEDSEPWIFFDSGAATHCCPKGFASERPLLPLTGKAPPLRSISGQSLTVYGRRLVKVDFEGQPCFLHFYVCDVPYCVVSVGRLLRNFAPEIVRSILFPGTSPPTLSYTPGELWLFHRTVHFFLNNIPENATLPGQPTSWAPFYFWITLPVSTLRAALHRANTEFTLVWSEVWVLWTAASTLHFPQGALYLSTAFNFPSRNDKAFATTFKRMSNL
eukprot:s1297_g21.t2